MEIHSCFPIMEDLRSEIVKQFHGVVDKIVIDSAPEHLSKEYCKIIFFYKVKGKTAYGEVFLKVKSLTLIPVDELCSALMGDFVGLRNNLLQRTT